MAEVTLGEELMANSFNNLWEIVKLNENGQNLIEEMWRGRFEY